MLLLHSVCFIVFHIGHSVAALGVCVSPHLLCCSLLSQASRRLLQLLLAAEWKRAVAPWWQQLQGGPAWKWKSGMIVGMGRYPGERGSVLYTKWHFVSSSHPGQGWERSSSPSNGRGPNHHLHKRPHSFHKCFCFICPLLVQLILSCTAGGELSVRHPLSLPPPSLSHAHKQTQSYHIMVQPYILNLDTD